MPTFLRQIMDAFLVRTEPDSSMVKPAHIHMTSAPQTKNEKVLRTNAVSSFTPAACAMAGRASKMMSPTIPATAKAAKRLRRMVDKNERGSIELIMCPHLPLEPSLHAPNLSLCIARIQKRRRNSAKKRRAPFTVKLLNQCAKGGCLGQCFIKRS